MASDAKADAARELARCDRPGGRVRCLGRADPGLDAPVSVEVEVTARIRAAWNRSPPDAATALREVPNVEERARLLARLWAGAGTEATEEERHYKRVLLILARQPSSTYSTFVFSVIERAFPEEHVEVWAALMLETDEGGEGG